MTPETALAIIRFAHFAAVLGLLGTIVFRQTMATPGVAAALAARFSRWEQIWAWTALLSWLAWLLPEAAIAGDGWQSTADPALLAGLASGTYFGQAWMVRAGLCLAAVLPLRGLSKSGFLVSVLMALSLGLIGHGVMLPGAAGIALRLSLALHATAAAVWIGALPWVAACFWGPGRAISLADAAASLKRFSLIGHWAVAATVTAGFATAQIILGGVPLSLAVLYQQLLTAKIACVAVMIALALANGYGLMPRLLAGHPKTQPGTARALAVISGLEVALSAMVLGLVAIFGDLSPAG